MHTRSIPRAGLALLIVTMMACPAYASPPSPESVEKLFNAMYPQDISDAMYSKLLPILTAQLKADIGQGRSADEAAKMYDELSPRIERLIKEQTSQTATRDDFVQIFSELFSQEEIQDLIAFYESPSGRAFSQKSSLVTEKTLALKQKRIGPLMSQIQKLVRDAIRAQGPVGIGAPPQNCFDRPCP
jgi:hypothetical protein